MFDNSLSLNETTDDSNQSFFGIGSHLWLNHQYLIRSIGYPVAVIIIAANPIVFEIISSYVRTAESLKNRLSLTRQYSFAFIFGGKRDALNASNALRMAHQKIKYTIDGVSYSPGEPDLMLWVFSALYYTSKKMNELLLTNIPFNEKTYEEYKILAQLYGISKQHLPYTMEDFEQYWNKALSERLVVTDACKAFVHSKFQLSIIDMLLTSKRANPIRFIFKPIDRLIRLFFIFLLPQQIADAFDLHLSAQQRLMMKYIFKGIRAIHHILPKQLTVENKIRRLLT